MNAGKRFVEILGSNTPGIIESTVCAVEMLGIVNDGRDLLRNTISTFPNDPTFIFHLACIEARLGNYREALIALQQANQLSQKYRSKTLYEPDFIPIWKHFASKTLSLDEATLLVDLNYKFILMQIDILDENAPLDFREYVVMPEQFRLLFTTAGIFPGLGLRLKRAANGTEVHLKYRDWRQSVFDDSKKYLEQARNNAWRVYSDSVIKSLQSMVASGNTTNALDAILIGAMNDWAFKDDLKTATGLEPIKYLVDSIVDALSNDRGFGLRLSLSYGLIKQGKPIEALNLMASASELLHANPIYQCVKSLALMKDHKYEDSLLLAIQVAEIWPLDPMCFGIAIECLVELGRMDEAKIMFNKAPDAYIYFKSHHDRMQKLIQDSSVGV